MYQFNSKEELTEFIKQQVVNTTESLEILKCSRQNFNDLIQRGIITPIKEFPRDRIFYKDDILNRKKETDMKKSR